VKIYKIVIPIFIISILLVPVVSADPTVVVDSYELTPSILMPGDTGILKLTIKNAETTNTIQSTSTIGSITTIRTDTDGATINNILIVPAIQGDSKIQAALNYKNVGELAPGSSIDVSFKIIVDKNIKEGVYFPVVRIDTDEVDVNFPILVTISNSSVDLIPTEVPSKISMSGSSELLFTAVNRIKTSVDNVIITPQNIDGVEITPSSIFLGTMEPFSTEDVRFSINPTEAGKKNLTFNISFLNGDNLHTDALNFSFETIEVLDVGSIFTSIPSSINKGSSARISLEVYNAKTESITGVLVIPETNAVLIPSQYFIGSMSPDDVFSASFDIYTDMLNFGNHAVEFRVVFKQGSEYYETTPINLTFSVISGEGASYQSSSDSGQSSPMSPGGDFLGTCLVIIVVLAVIVAVVLVFRWKKRRSG